MRDWQMLLLRDAAAHPELVRHAAEIACCAVAAEDAEAGVREPARLSAARAMKAVPSRS
jgi:hypothetical protein